MTKPIFIPMLGDQLPQRGNRFSKWLGRVLMRLIHWRVEGNICQSPKIIYVMGPHTSAADFFNNFFVHLALGLKASWFIADNFTPGIIGTVLNYFGAVRVDRSQNHGMVSRMVHEFERRDKFVLAIFPEGTRRRVNKWKTGFWYIAKQARVPVQLIAVDFGKRATVFGPVIELSDDIEKDMRTIRDYFRPVIAKHPERVDWSN